MNLKDKAQRYLYENGERCPFCLCDDIEANEEVDICMGGVSQGVKCPRCGAKWEDHYKLSGIVFKEGPTSVILDEFDSAAIDSPHVQMQHVPLVGPMPVPAPLMEVIEMLSQEEAEEWDRRKKEGSLS